MITHCPHGTWLYEDLCLSCFKITGEAEHFVCKHCGLEGDLRWADDHLVGCAKITGFETLGFDDLPF